MCEMKQKIPALFLALVLLLSLLAGCGSTESAVESTAPASSTEAQATEAPAPQSEEPQASESQPSSVEEPASAAESSESESVFSPYEWPLPLTDEDVTFSISMMINPQLASYYAGYEDNPSWQEYSKLTGVNFEFQNISAMNIGEQYNLMFA